MDKIINAMKFNDDPYDDENENEDPGYDTGYEDDTPQSSNADYEKEDELEMEELENTSVPRSTRRRSMGDAAPANRPTVKRQYSESGMEVCIVKPTSVNDASEVTDLILQGILPSRWYLKGTVGLGDPYREGKLFSTPFQC